MARIALAGAAVVIAVPASAAPLLFTLTYGANTATFTFDERPTSVPTGTIMGDRTNVLPTSGSFNGQPYDYGSNGLVFFNSNGGIPGGLIFVESDGSTVPAFSGPQIYSGPEDAPVFSTGSYNLTGEFGTPNGTLNVVYANAPGAPAPLLGMGLIPAAASLGGLMAMRSRRRKAAAA